MPKQTRVYIISIGDALDDLLRHDHQRGEQDYDGENPSFVDDFVIPELPSGQRLVVNILTTWGDQYYVGLNGIEVFNSNGKQSDITKQKITGLAS